MNIVWFHLVGLFAVLKASCVRKQSLTIFHLSPWAVIMNVCWNGLPPFEPNLKKPDVMTSMVF